MGPNTCTYSRFAVTLPLIAIAMARRPSAEAISRPRPSIACTTVVKERAAFSPSAAAWKNVFGLVAISLGTRMGIPTRAA